MRLIGVALVLLLIAACGDSNVPVGPPLFVYASEDDPANLPELFAAFTADTGIPIEPVWGNSSSNADTVIAKSGTPADVLITANVADIVRAADKGALRPIASESLALIQSELKDPDALWVTLRRRIIIIAMSPKSDGQVSVDYEALGQPAYQGKLCLSSVGITANQSLIAWLIEDLGRKPAERVVRGWVRNLALPPFATEAELVAALKSGDCQTGILSAPENTIGMTNIGTVPPYFDITAMGVGRHAQNPDNAQRFIDWVIVNRPQAGLAEWNGKNIGIAGWRNEEALLLAERAGFH